MAALTALEEALAQDPPSLTSDRSMSAALVTAGARDSVLRLLKACQTAQDAAVACTVLVRLPDIPMSTPFSDDQAAALRVAVRLLLRPGNESMSVCAMDLLLKFPVTDGLAAFAVSEGLVPMLAVTATQTWMRTTALPGVEVEVLGSRAVEVLTVWAGHPSLLGALARSQDCQLCLSTAVGISTKRLADARETWWGDATLARLLFLLAACSRSFRASSGPPLLGAVEPMLGHSVATEASYHFLVNVVDGAATIDAAFPQSSAHALQVLLHLSACPSHAARLLLACTDSVNVLHSVSTLLAGKYPRAVRLDAAAALVNLLAAYLAARRGMPADLPGTLPAQPPSSSGEAVLAHHPRQDGGSSGPAPASNPASAVCFNALGALLYTLHVPADSVLWVVLESASEEGDCAVAELVGQAAQLLLDVCITTSNNGKAELLASLRTSYEQTEQTVDSRWAVLQRLLHNRSPAAAATAAARLIAATCSAERLPPQRVQECGHVARSVLQGVVAAALATDNDGKLHARAELPLREAAVEVLLAFCTNHRLGQTCGSSYLPYNGDPLAKAAVHMLATDIEPATCSDKPLLHSGSLGTSDGVIPNGEAVTVSSGTSPKPPSNLFSSERYAGPFLQLSCALLLNAVAMLSEHHSSTPEHASAKQLLDGNASSLLPVAVDAMRYEYHVAKSPAWMIILLATTVALVAHSDGGWRAQLGAKRAAGLAKFLKQFAGQPPWYAANTDLVKWAKQLAAAMK